MAQVTDKKKKNNHKKNMLYLKKVSTVQNSESNDPFFNLVKSKNIYIVAAL